MFDQRIKFTFSIFLYLILNSATIGTMHLKATESYHLLFLLSMYYRTFVNFFSYFVINFNLRKNPNFFDFTLM